MMNPEEARFMYDTGRVHAYRTLEQEALSRILRVDSELTHMNPYNLKKTMRLNRERRSLNRALEIIREDRK